MTIKVGRMPYLNSDVFYRALPEDAAELIALTPRAMANALREGDLDAGPMPLAEIIRLGDDVVQLVKKPGVNRCVDGQCLWLDAASQRRHESPETQGVAVEGERLYGVRR